MFKKDMVTKKLHDGSSKKPDVVKHDGKGGDIQQLTAHNSVGKSGSAATGATLNNYAKATPAANPAPPDGIPALGTGKWLGDAL